MLLFSVLPLMFGVLTSCRNCSSSFSKTLNNNDFEFGELEWMVEVVSTEKINGRNNDQLKQNHRGDRTEWEPSSFQLFYRWSYICWNLIDSFPPPPVTCSQCNTTPKPERSTLMFNSWTSDLCSTNIPLLVLQTP